MELLTNEKIKSYLAHSMMTQRFANYVGMTRVGVIHRLQKETLEANMSNQFIDFMLAVLDSGGYINLNKPRIKKLDKKEINIEAHRLAQQEILRWWENTRGHRRACADLEARVKKVRVEMGSLGMPMNDSVLNFFRDDDNG